jgi:purine-nucleoside/S-methyl-5'-thioadenosine phosphorylase / adenosine deaminase
MWTMQPDVPLPLWRCDTRARLAFSTRRGGVSEPPFDTLNLGRSTLDRPDAVAENRRRILECLALNPNGLATAGQVHGAEVVEVTGAGHHPACDALVTRVRGLVLAVTTADCMSLLLTAPGIVAAVHSGWRGTEAGMPRAALEAVCRASGATPDQVHVHFGPCIRGCCYEVGPEVAARFPAAAITTPRPGARPHLDLPAAARAQLAQAGVPAAACFDVGACTSCDPAWYFSHRRDRGRTGRHWALAALADADADAGGGAV